MQYDLQKEKQKDWIEQKNVMDFFSPSVWNTERRPGDTEKEGFGEKLYHRGTVCVYTAFFFNCIAGRGERGGNGVEVLFLHSGQAIYRWPDQYSPQ